MSAAGGALLHSQIHVQKADTHHSADATAPHHVGQQGSRIFLSPAPPVVARMMHPRCKVG